MPPRCHQDATNKHTNVIQNDYYQDMAYRFIQRIKQVKIKKNQEKELFDGNYKRLDFSLVNIAEYNLDQKYFEQTLKLIDNLYRQNQSLAKEIITKYYQNEHEVLVGFLLTTIQNSEINIKDKWFNDLLKSRTDIKDKSLLEQINKLIVKA